MNLGISEGSCRAFGKGHTGLREAFGHCGFTAHTLSWRCNSGDLAEKKQLIMWKPFTLIDKL